MEERSDQLNASQKEALLEKFKLDQVTFGLDHVVQALQLAVHVLQVVLTRSKPIQPPQALSLGSNTIPTQAGRLR